MTIRVLVIDDVALNLQHFQELFQQLGVQVMLADSAEAGLKVIKKQPVDVIFLDYNMPGMNGFEFVEEFRQINDRSEIPVVMMSTDMMINELAVSQGLAQAWIIKRATVPMVENILKTLGVW